MESKIGEIFEHKGEWYQCLESSSFRCGDCDFDELGDCDIIACASGERKDGKDVIFAKLEKVGEIYEENGRLLQKYKVHRPIVGINEDELNTIIAIEIKQTNEDMEENYKTEDTPLTRLVGRYVNNLIDYETFEEAVKELYSDKEDSKPALKEFDLEAAKAGKSVCTRGGRKARIICFNRNSDRPIVVLIERDGSEEILMCCFDNGRCFSSITSDYDLMMLPEKKEGWINVYKMKESTFGYITSYFDTEENAKEEKEQLTGYVATVKINWEE